MEVGLDAVDAELGLAGCDRQHVDLDRHRLLDRQLVLPVDASEWPAIPDDDRRVPHDLTGGPDRVLQLRQPHPPTQADTLKRSSCGNRPPRSDTSRI